MGKGDSQVPELDAEASRGGTDEDWAETKKEYIQALTDMACGMTADPIQSASWHTMQAHCMKKQISDYILNPQWKSNLPRLYVLLLRCAEYCVKIMKHQGYSSCSKYHKESVKHLCEQALTRAPEVKAALHKHLDSRRDEASREPEDDLDCAPSAPPMEGDGSPLQSLEASRHVRFRSGDALEEWHRPLIRTAIASTCPDLNAARLKPIHVPQRVLDGFMAGAQENTLRSIETCALLGAVEADSGFQITAVIFPKQIGKSDYCEARGEEEMLMEVMKRDLIIVGWIHTHPSQSAFLSAVDLHMQCSYQLSLPEAIAIVMAPSKQPNMGIFNLTDAGLAEVRNCREAGFHPHSKQSFTVCQHATISPSGTVEIVDLRNA